MNLGLEKGGGESEEVESEQRWIELDEAKPQKPNLDVAAAGLLLGSAAAEGGEDVLKELLGIARAKRVEAALAFKATRATSIPGGGGGSKMTR